MATHQRLLLDARSLLVFCTAFAIASTSLAADPEQVGDRSGPEAPEISKEQRPLVLWLASRYENAAKLHQYAVEQTEQPQVREFGDNAADLARRASSRLRSAVASVGQAQLEAGASPQASQRQSPDLSETAGEIGEAIQERLRQRSQQQGSGQAASADQNQSDEGQRRVILPAVRKNLPEILELAAQAIEDEEGSGRMIQQQARIQDRILRAKQEELKQYQGPRFDQAYLGLAFVSSLELKAATEVTAADVGSPLQSQLNSVSQELSDMMQQARQMMEPSARDGSARGGEAEDQ